MQGIGSIISALGEGQDTEAIHLTKGELKKVQKTLGQKGKRNPLTGLLGFWSEADQDAMEDAMEDAMGPSAGPTGGVEGDSGDPAGVAAAAAAMGDYPGDMSDYDDDLGFAIGDITSLYGGGREVEGARSNPSSGMGLGDRSIADWGPGGTPKGFGPGEQFGPQKSDGGGSVYGTDRGGYTNTYLGQENVVGPNPGYGFGGYGLADHLAKRDAYDYSYDDLGNIKEEDWFDGSGGILSLLGGIVGMASGVGFFPSLLVNAGFTNTFGRIPVVEDVNKALTEAKNEVVGSIIDLLPEGVEGLGENVKGAVGDLWDTVTKPISEGWPSVKEALENDEPVPTDWSDYGLDSGGEDEDEDDSLQRTLRMAQVLNDQANIDSEPEVSSNIDPDVVNLIDDNIDRKNWYRRYQGPRGEPVFGETEFAGPAYYEEVA
jgi:hypothetical protein